MSVTTLLDAKAHLRVLDTDDDVYIQSLLDTAEAQAEEITSRYFSQRSAVFYLNGYVDSFEIPKSPLVSIDSIEYIADGETVYTLLDSSFYSVDDAREPALVRFDESFSVSDGFKVIKVTYTAGYAVLPLPLKQWVLMRVATMYENREEIVVGVSANTIDNRYNDFLLLKYKVGRL